jgi:ribosomal protein S12 methylthiotransferase accessory factor YcaO
MHATNGDGIVFPALVMQEATISTRLPKVTWAMNSLGNSSSGAGLHEDSLLRCMGEYFERRHFYFEVTPDGKDNLFSMMQKSDAENFLLCLEQSSNLDVKNEIKSHNFNKSNVFKWPSFEPSSIPTVFVSLSDELLESDATYLPSRDTSGCSVHFEFDIAIAGAIREVIERQYLLKYWLTTSGGINISANIKNCLSSEAEFLKKILLKNGSLNFLEISCGETPGAIVLAVYKGPESSKVRYCVGLSYEESIVRAADKALKELWQSFNFLENFAESEYSVELIKDKYHTYFLTCNTTKVADLMNTEVRAPDTLDIRKKEDLNEHVAAKFGEFFIYARQMKIVNKTLWCIRAINPNVFVHIDNTKHFNLKNSFSHSFFEQVQAVRLACMVPFP